MKNLNFKNNLVKANAVFAFFLASIIIFFSADNSLGAPGDLDTSFGVGGKATIQFGNLSFDGGYTLVQPDGKIVIAGSTYVDSKTSFAAARYNSNGTADTSFGNQGYVYTHIGISLDRPYAAALQTDGKIIVVGMSWTTLEQFGLVRYNSDGTLDTSFNGTGRIVTDMINDVGNDRATSVKVQPDGRIVVGGTCSNKVCIARYNTNGSLDESFDGDGKMILSQVILNNQEAAAAIALQSDGKIVATGNVRLFSNGDNEALTVRFNTDGSLDQSFGNNGRVTTAVAGHVDFMNAIAIKPDGKIIVAGNIYRPNNMNPPVYTDYDFGIIQYNPDGSLDTTFDADGMNTVRFSSPKQYFDDFLTSVSIQQNGKIIVGGYGWDGSKTNFELVRFMPDGSLDPDFGNNGKFVLSVRGLEDKAYSMAIQRDGKILIGGRSHNVTNVDFAVVRLIGDPILNLINVPFDFDGDRKTDISIFRPTAGEWWYLRSSDLSNRAFAFGSSSDKLVPADYTGDGKTDVAFWRESTGEWFILRSEDSSFYSFPFGSLGDIPAPADFDGDGRADPAVFRPSNATWYIVRSSDGGVTIAQFGASGDLPVAADYDGDSKADLAVFRPSDGSWWLNRSSAGLIVTNFGSSSDKTVQADYTGDGKADVAFFRPSSGEWFILRSEDFSFYSFPFGASGDIPSPGDYDGDGRTDPAVFRNSAATWYINGTTSGTQIAQFGASGDTPVPNAFVR